MRKYDTPKESGWRRWFLIALSFLGVVVIVIGAYLVQQQRNFIFSLEAKIDSLEAKQLASQRSAQMLDLRVGSLEEGLRNHVMTFNSRLSKFDARVTHQERVNNDLSYRLEEVSSELGSLTDRFLSGDVRAKVDLGDITVGRGR